MPASTTTFDYTREIVTYTVPTTGIYSITATGAAGGGSGDPPGAVPPSTSGYLYYAGGSGAEASGEVALTAGEVVQIAVGGVGGSVDYGYPAGGGGGSFVVGPGDTPLEIGGGGGGAAGIIGAGGDATGVGAGDGAGGAGGGGTGGGGLLGDGGDVIGWLYPIYGGSSFVDGAAGGLGITSGGFAGNGDGGFGGGGGGGELDGFGIGAGGGGGYTGGDGGASLGWGYPGSGGSSFTSGTDQQVTLGASTGDGLVTITYDVPDAPIIGGTTQPETTDEATVNPFSTLTITDPEDSPTDQVTVTYTAANGTLTDPNAATDDSGVSAGDYTVSGTAAEVQADLQGLIFTPTAHQVAPGDTVTTDFTLSVTNSVATEDNEATSVVATALDDAPVITGTRADQLVAAGATIQPFGGVSIADPDVDVMDVLYFTVTGAGGTFSAPPEGTGVSLVGPATYALPPGTVAELTSELDALGFTPSAAGTATTFDLSVQPQVGADSVSTTDDTTTVALPDFIYGPAGGSGDITGIAGTDVITAYGASNTIHGEGGDDTIFAGSGSAVVDLTSDNARMDLGGGDNTVEGGDGNVTVTGAPGGSTVVSLGNGDDTVIVGGENDTIVLGNGNDGVAGTTGMAFIRTGNGDDTITLGGSGNNVYAGGGNNEIQGGTGNDTFILSPAGSGFDTIAGFSETNGDVLDLRTLLAATTWDGNLSTLGDYLIVTDSGGNTDLAIAPTGSGAGVADAELLGAGNLGLADLLSHDSLLTS